MTAQQISTNALAPGQPDEINYFQLHANYIFYPLAILAKAISTRALLLSLFVLSFTGLVLFAYFGLRGRGVPITAAALFCLFIVFHPAWSTALTWQFYPERLFVLLGFAFMSLVSKKDAGRTALIVAAVACAAISERAAMMAGAFVVLYTLLYWRIDARGRPFRLALGAILGAYGIIVLKMVIVNPEYSSFLPNSLQALLNNFQSATFVQHLGVFALVNLVLLTVALFEWRAALIACAFMVPNVIGNLGGSEKVGWYTHYHDLYLPALVWAAAAGFAAAYRMAAARERMPAFYGATCALVLFLGSIDPYASAKNFISPANLANNFFARFVADSEQFFGPDGKRIASSYDLIAQTIPVGSVVSSPEAGMSTLYHGRTLRFFPVGVDRADYTIMSFARDADGRPVFGGDVPYFVGADEARRVDKVLVARMKRDGYDFAHAVMIPRLSLAVVKRVAPAR